MIDDLWSVCVCLLMDSCEQLWWSVIVIDSFSISTQEEKKTLWNVERWTSINWLTFLWIDWFLFVLSLLTVYNYNSHIHVPFENSVRSRNKHDSCELCAQFVLHNRATNFKCLMFHMKMIIFSISCFVAFFYFQSAVCSLQSQIVTINRRSWLLCATKAMT